MDDSTTNPDITTLGGIVGFQTALNTDYRGSIYAYGDASSNAKMAMTSRSDIVFVTYKGGGDGRSMIIKETTGNVGIGTVTPSGRLTITNTGGGYSPSSYLQINSTTANNLNYPGIELRGGTLANTYPSVILSNGGLALTLGNGYHTTSYPSQQTIDLNAGTAYISFNTSVSGTPSARMVVTNSGFVGIGTTTPAYRLNVVGGNEVGSRFFVTGTYAPLQFTAPRVVPPSPVNCKGDRKSVV